MRTPYRRHVLKPALALLAGASALLVTTGGAAAPARGHARTDLAALPGELVFGCEAGCHDPERSGLLGIRPDGTGLRVILEGDCDASGCTLLADPAVSRDGRQIAFERTTTRAGGSGRAEIWRTGADGSQPRRVAFSALDNRAPDWAPDSRRLVFTRETSARYGTTFLWVVRADGSGARRLLRMRDAAQPAWSPAGNKIGFVGTNNRFFAVRPDGARLLRLGGRRVAGVLPRWSPAGRRLAFSPRVAPNENAGVAILDPTGRVRAAPVPRRPVLALSWSPDGRWIAAALFRQVECDEDDCPKYSEVWVVRLHDGYRKVILSVPGGPTISGLDWRQG
jgi:Tol biopolymer transport system component